MKVSNSLSSATGVGGAGSSLESLRGIKDDQLQWAKPGRGCQAGAWRGEAGAFWGAEEGLGND